MSAYEPPAGQASYGSSYGLPHDDDDGYEQLQGFYDEGLEHSLARLHSNQPDGPLPALNRSLELVLAKHGRAGGRRKAHPHAHSAPHFKLPTLPVATQTITKRPPRVAAPYQATHHRATPPRLASPQLPAAALPAAATHPPPLALPTTASHQPMLSPAPGRAHPLRALMGAAGAAQPSVHALLNSPGLGAVQGAADGSASPTPCSPGATNNGSMELDEIDALLDAIGNDMDGPEAMSGSEARLMSLPCTLCTSATGDTYMVGLSEVQHMLHKRRLGPKGLAILQRFENTVVHPLDALALKSAVNQDAGQGPRVQIKAGPRVSIGGPGLARGDPGGRRRSEVNALDGVGRESVAGTRRSSRVGGGSSYGDVQDANNPEGGEDNADPMHAADHDQLDEEVRRHLEQVMDLVEMHREHLIRNNARTLAEQERMTHNMNQAAKTQAAIDFIVNKLVPEKLIAMARTRRSRVAKGGGPTGTGRPSLLKHVRDVNPHPGSDGSAGLQPRGSAALGEDAGEEGGQHSDFLASPLSPVITKSMSRWDLAASKVSMDKLPFMANWGASIKKLRKDPGMSWDDYMNNAQLGIGGSKGKNQGAQVYMLKCQELGVVPSTQVVQQLRLTECNISHCKLGRRGAQALRHALAINTSITDLNLMDNGLDAQAVAEVITGLTYGFTARKPRQVPQSTHTHSHLGMDLVKLTTHSTDLAINVIPASLRGAASGPDGVIAAQAPPAGVNLRAQRQRRLDAAQQQRQQRQMEAMASSLEREGSLSPSLSPRLGRGPDEEESLISPHASVGSEGSGYNPFGSLRRQAGPRQVAQAVEPHKSSVQHLDLSMNPLGVNGGRMVAELVDPAITPSQFLVELRLEKCGLPEAGGIAICNALQHYNRTLKTLSLANNMLGNKTANAFGVLLMENATLTDLDLGWNQIKAEGVKGLRKGIEGSMSLTRLVLAWNGLENEGAVEIGDMLRVNASLRHLDLTNTRLGCDACFMIGEGIKANTTLEELLLNGNAIGDDGARHLMAALKDNKSLEYLGLQGSNMSSAARGQHGAADFNPLAPEGAYSLVLDEPTDRAVALQLCKFDFASTRGDLMTNIKLDGISMKSCKAMNWPEQLPESGTLVFEFVARRSQKLVQVMDSKKFQAVVNQLESRSMSDVEKLSLVEVIAPFTYLYCHQVASIIRCFSMGDELVRAAALLFTRAADLEENIDALTGAMQERDIHELHQHLGWFSYCRFSNPTGHYELNLTTPVHQAFAVRLKDIAYGEPNEGNNWYNIVYDMYSHAVKVACNYGPPDIWKGVIPQRGTVSFDYVSTSRPPADSTAISDEELMEFLHYEIGIQLDDAGNVVQETDYSAADLQLALLRQEAGHRFWFTCAQVQKIASCFLAGPHKVEAIVMMWALIVDRKNFWQIVYSLDAFNQSLLSWRLGPLNVLDKHHPSQHYVLDLSNPTHEQVARRLVDMAAKNPEVPNFWNIRLQGVKKIMPESANMWGTLTAESFTPFLEFDFIYVDAWETGMLGKTKADSETLGKFDKIELLGKQAKRMEMQRIKAMYGYFYDGSGYSPPMWHTRSQMFKALIEKSPWLAAWDRLMRLLVRLDLRSGDIATDSYIEDIFDSKCSDDGELTAEAFESLCREWGYSRGEVHFHYRRLFDAAARPSLRPDAVPALHGRRGTSNNPPPGSRGASQGGGQLMHLNDPPMSESSASNLGAADAPGPQQRAQNSGTPEPQPGRRPAATTFGPTMVVDFPTFVNLFMQEPAPELRFKELPSATHLGTLAAVSKARANFKKAPQSGQVSLSGAAAVKKK